MGANPGNISILQVLPPPVICIIYALNDQSVTERLLADQCFPLQYKQSGPAQIGAPLELEKNS